MSAPDSPSAVIFEQVPRVDSTNAALLRRPWDISPSPPRALLADVQTAGRGRQGRPWWTAPGSALALSVAFERPVSPRPWTGLSLALGVVVADILARHGATVGLKWPNDLYVRAAASWAKAGGLLIEIRREAGRERLVAGCGLNLQPDPALQATLQAAAAPNTPPAVPPAGLFAPGRAPGRRALAEALASAMVHTITEFAQHGLAPWADRWCQLDVLADQRVWVHHPDGRRESGRAQGIDATGALRVRTDAHTVLTVHSADVNIRLV